MDSDAIEAVQDDYLRWVEGLPEPVRNPARDLLMQIDPGQWRLEWMLPLWLGEWLGLPDEESLLLSLSNIMGLAYVRIEDDRLDSPGEGESVELSTLLFERAISNYRSLFASSSPFWPYLERTMESWRQAQAASQLALSVVPPDPGERVALDLGRRGAPLLIGVAAALELAECSHLLPEFETTLAYRNGASVLLDHAQDWHADLIAGRGSLFIGSLCRLPQKPEYRLPILTEVTSALMTQSAGPYFERMDQLAVSAEERAMGLGFHRLVEHFQSWRDGAGQYEYRLYEGFQTGLEEAVEGFGIRD